LSPLVSASSITGHNGCIQKKHALQTQIEWARAYNNGHRLARLKAALARVDAYCTDDSMIYKREDRVKAALKKVRERRAELSDAIKKGDPEKIKKRKYKLAESQYELQRLQDSLEDYK
jgi:hypothetical protein